MPRPKKPVNCEEELAKINAQITKHQNTIKELMAKKEELVQLQRQQELELLRGAVAKPGLSIEEVLEKIKK